MIRNFASKVYGVALQFLLRVAVEINLFTGSVLMTVLRKMRTRAREADPIISCPSCPGARTSPLGSNQYWRIVKCACCGTELYKAPVYSRRSWF